MLPLVVLLGHLRSPQGQALALVAAGTPVSGQAGSLLAQPVCRLHLAAGTAKADGVVLVRGEVMVAPEEVHLAAHGAPRPAESTATRGPPGLLVGVLSPRGPVPGLAAAVLLLRPSQLLSPPLSLLAALLKSSPAPPLVSRLLQLRRPLAARITALPLPSAVSALAVRSLPPFSSP